MVRLQGELHMRFRINEANVDLKVVTQHVYLGSVIGYRKLSSIALTWQRTSLPDPSPFRDARRSRSI